MINLYPPREPFNAWSHFAGAVAALIFLVFLMIASAQDSRADQFTFFVYGLTVILMFASSWLYHAVNSSKRAEKEFKRIDHIMIYAVIAGTYTPIVGVPLDGAWRLGMLIGIWTFAVVGVLKKIYWLDAPRWLSTLLYLLMGWVSVIIFPQLWEALPHAFSYWIAAGGLCYTIGAVIYGLRKPNPYPGIFAHHEIWHIFVIGGAFCHYWAIYYYLPGFNL